jgi:hypothetical protein
MCKIHKILLRKWKVHMKRYGLQNLICFLPFDQYEALTPTEQHAFEKIIEAEQSWSKLSFDVCLVCQGCHLPTMRKTLVELGHTNERHCEPICGSCANNPKKNTTQNRVSPYWIDRHGFRHTTVPEELDGLTLAEKKLIGIVSSHMSFIHLKNDNLGSNGHCIAVEQKVIDPSNIYWSGDNYECLLPINCNIDTQDDYTPEDDELGPSSDQTIMEHIDKIECLDFEVSGTLDNTDSTITKTEDAEILEEIRNSHSVNDKVTTINWPSFSETPISEYIDQRVLYMLFPWPKHPHKDTEPWFFS